MACLRSPARSTHIDGRPLPDPIAPRALDARDPAAWERGARRVSRRRVRFLSTWPIGATRSSTKRLRLWGMRRDQRIKNEKRRVDRSVDRPDSSTVRDYTFPTACRERHWSAPGVKGFAGRFTFPGHQGRVVPARWHRGESISHREDGRFQGLRKLAGATGQALRLGVVLYDGTHTAPFGDRLFAAPVSCV